jgi:hypothetical protein
MRGAPVTIEGFNRLNRIQAATDTNLTQIKFGDPEKTIQVRSPSEAAELLPRYLYDEEKIPSPIKLQALFILSGKGHIPLNRGGH